MKESLSNAEQLLANPTGRKIVKHSTVDKIRRVFENYFHYIPCSEMVGDTEDKRRIVLRELIHQLFFSNKYRISEINSILSTIPTSS